MINGPVKWPLILIAVIAIIFLPVVDPLKMDESGTVPPEVMKAMGEQGAFGIQVRPQ